MAAVSSPPILLDESPLEGTADRVLDAALARFSSQGIEETTMSQLAADVGISRVWLYRHFENRDAVARALMAREARRFLADLASRDYQSAPVVDVVVDSFDYVVGAIRGSVFLQRVLRSEPEIVAPLRTGGRATSAPMRRVAVTAAARYLQDRTSLTPAESRAAAETIIRLIVSVVESDDSTFDFDFDDRRQRRAFARHIIPRLLAPAR
jgi:AcrR family transcriptional regulator